MKKGKHCLSATMSKSLIAVSLCLGLPLAVGSAGAADLSSESASLDTAQAANTGAPTTASEPTTLFGSVRKHQAALDATDTASASPLVPLDASDSAAQLQSQTAANADAGLYALAVQKISSGQELSCDEYRSLGVGCVGLESDRTFFQSIAKVTAVYRGSPAEKAGIHVGDRLVAADTDIDEQARANPSQPLWSVLLERAGTPQEVTVLRRGTPEKIALIRMNIEDIENTKIRRMWEKMVSNLGSKGQFTSTSLKALESSSR